MLNKISESAAVEARVWAALHMFEYPLFASNLVDLNAVRSVVVEGGCVYIALELGVKVLSHHARLQLMLQSYLESAGIANTNISIDADVLPADPNFKSQHDSQPTSRRDTRLRNIVLVASGKGGVGKSSTAINLALALRAEGASVGVLDADIYGPSMRTMLGVPVTIKPTLVDEKFVTPIKKYGLETMSVGYMSADKAPMIWRGPMAVKALQQLLDQTLWGSLDYLIVDMPPGTGDIHISLAQKLHRATAVVVTTPQEVALIDARKGMEMFTKVGIPVLGVVENMATHVCSNCGHEEDIFGAHGAQQMAEDYGVAVLGSLPLAKQIREHLDSGHPTVARDPASPIAQSYFALAQQVAVTLWKTNLHPTLAPSIEIVG